MLVLGLPCLVAGTLCYFIPETKNKELPQNMKDTLNNDNIEEMIEMNKAEIDKEKPIIKTKAWNCRWIMLIISKWELLPIYSIWMYL